MLKSKYLPPIDKERTNAKDYSKLSRWFELYSRLKAEHSIEEEDIYNMDEKGFLQGAIAKMRVMIHKEETQQHVTQDSNREWVTLIECVSADSRVLKPWIIFKAKLHQKSWYDEVDEGHICVGDNGWTNNEIGLQWLIDGFDKETKDIKKGKYRVVCLDGHASHITTAAIDSCIQHDIVLLCLPAHTTDILQPLDISVFAPLSVHYKNIVHENTKLHGSYSIDKNRFIRYYLQARKMTFSPSIIHSRWQKAGLCPFEPSVVLNKCKPEIAQEPPKIDELKGDSLIFYVRPPTPPEGALFVSNADGQSINYAMTPANTAEVAGLVHNMRKGFDKEIVVDKLARATIFAMANTTIQSITNQELVDASKRNDDK